MLTYRKASPGHWVSFLIPLALVLNESNLLQLKLRKSESESEIKILIAIILLNTILLNVLHHLKYNVEKLLKKLIYVNISLSMSIVGLWYLSHRKETFYEIFGYLSLAFLHPYVFKTIVKNCPGSFTFGEAILTTQAFFISFWYTTRILPFPPSNVFLLPEANVLSYITALGVLSSFILARIIFLGHFPWKFYFIEEFYTLWAKSCVVSFLVYRLPDGIWKLYDWSSNFFFASRQRKVVLNYWLICLVFSIIVVLWKSFSKAVTSKSIDRKYFHFLIVAAYLPGILRDFNLLYLSSTAIMCIFLLIELTRAIKFKLFGSIPIGKTIDDHVSIFRDSQDQGNLILTPIYLLAGCTLPLWLLGPHDSLNEFQTAVALSGITSIGIGDTFASIGGQTFGKHRWNNSKKTIEGTVYSIVSQIGFIIMLQISGYTFFSFTTIICLLISIVTNALVEAKTDQIDNIVLPLLTFNVIHLCKLLTL